MGMKGGFGGFGGARGGTGSFGRTPARERSSFKHLGHLKRLFPYLKRYRWTLGSSVLGLMVKRSLIMLTPIFLIVAIDRLADP